MVSAAINGYVVVDSACVVDAQDEGALAGTLSYILAPLFSQQRQEEISHQSFREFALIPDMPLIVTTLVRRRLLLFAVPYVAMYALAWWSFYKVRSEFGNENLYTFLRVTRKAGYNIEDFVRRYESDLSRNERFLQEAQARKSQYPRAGLRPIVS
jgi:hypothetical protein